MYIVKLVRHSGVKFFKGTLFLFVPCLLASLGMFILDSCKKNELAKSDSGVAARQFLDALSASKNQIGSIILNNNNLNMSSLGHTSMGQGPSMIESTSTMEELLHLDFPTGTDPVFINEFNNGADIQNIAYALTNYNVSVQDSVNAATEISLQLPIAEITASLQPLVVAAENYLIAKGFTNQSIQDMIQEEGVTELELIPFVKALATIEQDQYAVGNFSMPFINSASALNHFLECGLIALGADALYALSLSGASSWTYAAMRTAFTGVAKRFLGPIGVAIAVVSFGVCMLN